MIILFGEGAPDGGGSGRPVHRSNGGWFRACGCVVIGVGWYRRRSPATRSEGEEGNREVDEGSVVSVYKVRVFICVRVFVLVLVKKF